MTMNNNTSSLEITAILNSQTRNNNNEIEGRSDDNANDYNHDYDYDYDYDYNDCYDEYSDFAVNRGNVGGRGGGVGGCDNDSRRTKKISNKKVHQDNNTMIYSSKHIRAKEELSSLDRRKIKNKSNSKMRSEAISRKNVV